MINSYPSEFHLKDDVQVLGLAGPNSGALVERLTDQQDWPFLQARQVKLYSSKLDRWVDHEHVQMAVSFQLFLWNFENRI